MIPPHLSARRPRDYIPGSAARRWGVGGGSDFALRSGAKAICAAGRHERHIDAMGEEFTLEDALIILQRRFLYFLIPVAILVPLGVTVVMLLPAKYKAEGTILVESQQIPPDLVRSTIHAYAQERIQTIKQRVMTRNRLLEVADKYALFSKDKALSESERVKLMRERLDVSLITTTMRRNSSRDGTIAFTVSYTDRSPDKAFQVANEFMTLFLTEDVRTRTAGASNTTEFFQQESRRLRDAVDVLEQRIADYKRKNSKALPEHLDMHLSMLERATDELGTTNASINSLEEELRFLETQLAGYSSGSNSESGPSMRLAELRSELVQLQAVYQDAHPNVQAVKDQIAALERELAPSRAIQSARRELIRAQAALAEAEKTSPEDETRLDAMRADIERREQRLARMVSTEVRSGASDFPSVQLEGRIALASSQLRTLEKRRAQLNDEIADLQTRISQTPEVERGLSALTRDYDNVFREYQEVLAKQQDAQLAENLEDNQKAEKFSILETALRPEKPSSPERGKLIVLALFSAFAVGGGGALGAELLFATVRGRDHLSNLMGTHPIAVIPYIHRGDEPRFNLPFVKPKQARAAAHSA